MELPRGFGTAPSLAILDLTYNNLSDDSFPGNFSYLGGNICVTQIIRSVQFYIRYFKGIIHG